ncbi:tetratricopeptide repeat domain-containing protein [Hirsutella rhossiliensis]|uniref:Tetratricopeptide repeat domain-containing protein n=1 Tax=Hirsutella rhossiliensis TaxID=111463 RepID=A0A9P8N9G5_9HYPO|nr:tetratricopeptide repeat domain-containing protein [Hirsutella rhossiliensis]KAH0968189.1 tetratricopeptide repeat domain-containing protein [Hirsutella rhossiliensis]
MDPHSSPLWHQALEKYLDELQGAEDYRAIQDVQSLEQLIASFASIQTTAGTHFGDLSSLKRLAPRLKFVDDFSAVLALCFGADAALTAAVWGSIRLILMHASSAAETLQDVLDMLEELSLTLPRLQVYEQTMPPNRQLQQALVDVYCETICFYARTIHFLRSNPHLVLRKNAWQTFRNDFSHTIMRIKRMSSTVESEADMARMREDGVRYREVLELLNAIKMGRTDDKAQTGYHNIPFSCNVKFSGREHILDTLEKALGPKHVSSPNSMALFGMGGVGKTQIAVQYAHQSLERYEVILWVAAENAITIGQSFRVIAQGLGLLGTDGVLADGAAAIWKVKNWLITTTTTCLVIFDNADDINTLKTAWPGATRGPVSMLLTTRDLTIATTLAAQHENIGALSDEDGSKLLLKAVGLDSASSTEVQLSLAISQMFGGLPLALAQIGGFITQRRISLQEFLPLYERYSAKIDARGAPGSDYEHTLSTVWNISFEKLTKTSTVLLNLLSFLSPDKISENILLRGSHGLDDRFKFLSDEMDLGDASEELLRAALINRTGGSTALSIHRLVQSAAREKLDESESAECFDTAAHILCWGFPDHSSTDIGHQSLAWARCEDCLPHFNYLVELARGRGKNASNRQKFADLLLRCSWYLYEREVYIIARGMVEQAMSAFDDTTSLAYASAIDLHGLIDLDLAQAARALKPFEHALEIRKARLGPEDPFIAYSLNNIALAYTEMGELDLAHEAHQEAIRLRLKANSDRIGNSYSNMASLLLRMGRPDDAEKMLARCPSLVDFTDETFLSTGNPRFSGDMVLLSRIRLSQGRPTEALRLASKALAFRRESLGNRLKTCDSQYDVASMLLNEGHTSSAIQLLEEIVSMSETFVEGKGQRARALHKLSAVLADKGMQIESEKCKEKALELLAELKPELKDAPYEEAEFSKLCLWMLW